MKSGFVNKFFLKSLIEITGDKICEFYTDNCIKETKELVNHKEHYPSGRPKLFQKMVVFLSGLETSFNMNNRDKETKKIINSLTDKESPFQKLLNKEYSKV